jgi:pimeloyl-ACP methyl ester carboxylesterase
MFESEEVNGFNLAFVRHGKGETVLLVHGITTWSFIFRHVIEKLKNDFDVIALDLLGCGNSDKAFDADLSLKNHACLINKFTEKLNIKKFHFVGHDLGGGIGQIFAVNHPEKLIDLTLINSVGYNFWPVQPIIAMRTPIIRELAIATLDFGTFRFIVKRGLYHKEKCTDELMKYFWKPMNTKEGRKSFLRFAQCLDNKNLTEISAKLKSLKIPSMIVRGDGDVYLSSAISEKLNSEIPGSILERISTAGHFLMEDEPEWLCERLKKFYEKRFEKR